MLVVLYLGVVGFYYRFRLLPPAPTAFAAGPDGEITFLYKSFNSQTPYTRLPAMQAIQYVNATLPEDAVIGAGTIVTPEDLKKAVEAGSTFLVSPGTTPELIEAAKASGKICAVNYCYSAYPMVRQARAMVRAGEIGKVRLVVTNFSHGHHGDYWHQGHRGDRYRFWARVQQHHQAQHYRHLQEPFHVRP